MPLAGPGPAHRSPRCCPSGSTWNPCGKINSASAKALQQLSRPIELKQRREDDPAHVLAPHRSPTQMWPRSVDAHRARRAPRSAGRHLSPARFRPVGVRRIVGLGHFRAHRRSHEDDERHGKTPTRDDRPEAFGRLLTDCARMITGRAVNSQASTWKLGGRDGTATVAPRMRAPTRTGALGRRALQALPMFCCWTAG